MIMNLFTLGARHRLIVFLFLLISTVFFSAGLGKLTVDTGVDSLIPSNDPNRIIYQKIIGEFGTDNKTIIYLRDKELWTPTKLEQFQSLHHRLEEIKYVTRVESLFSLHTIENIEGNINPRPLFRQLPLTLDESLEIREKAIGNPLYIGNFISDDANVTALIVSIRDVSEHPEFSLEFNKALNKTISKHQNNFDELFQVGPPRVRAELQNSLYEDFVLLGPLSAIILVISILFFMRSFLAAIIPLITSCLAIIWTFGMLGWIGIPINILSAMLPSLIIVIGSTEDTHIMAAFYRGLDSNEDTQTHSRKTAIEYMAKHIGLPLMLTVFTTAMGFASNMLGQIELIQNFAIASTFAMFANGFITLLAVPLLLSLLGPNKSKVNAAYEQKNSLPNRIIKLFRYSQDKFPNTTLALTALMCIFFIFQASKLYVTNDPLSYFPSDRPLIKNTHKIHEDLAGIKLFFINLEAKTKNAFQSPKNIEKLAQIQDFMDKQGVFDRSISLADYLLFVNQEFRGEDSTAKLPKSRELVSQYLLFFHRNDLDSYVSHDYSRANIIVRHNINASHILNGYIQELNEVVQDISGAELNAHIIGENLMVNQAAETLMVAQVKALALLLGLIFIIMSIMFTSLKGGAIALFPAIIPIAMMFGIMSLLDIPLNPGTAMVAVIAVGIAIDGSIHLLARYNELCRRTSDYVEAVHQSVKEEATPLIASSLALAFGFGILLLSNFSVVAQFGALAAATMLFSIFANLLITPILMTRIRLVGLYQIIAMKVDKSVLDKTPLFKDMNDYQRKKAVLISELNEFKYNELLVEQDTTGRDMFLILSGTAEVIRRDGENSRTLAQLEAGQIFGEIGYIRETNRTADVRATSDVTALRFDYDRMQKDLKYFPNIVAKLNFNISYILGERLADMVERIDQ